MHAARHRKGCNGGLAFGLLIFLHSLRHQCRIVYFPDGRGNRFVLRIQPLYLSKGSQFLLPGCQFCSCLFCFQRFSFRLEGSQLRNLCLKFGDAGVLISDGLSSGGQFFLGLLALLLFRLQFLILLAKLLVVLIFLFSLLELCLQLGNLLLGLIHVDNILSVFSFCYQRKRRSLGIGRQRHHCHADQFIALCCIDELYAILFRKHADHDFKRKIQHASGI